MNELDFSKTIAFEVLGDIKPTVKEVLGYYATMNQYDNSAWIYGTHLEFPAFRIGVLTYHGWQANESDKQIIEKLYTKGIIKVREVRV